MWSNSIDKIFVINTYDEIGHQRWPVIEKELSVKKIPSFIRYEAIKNVKDGAIGLLHTMRILFEENRDMNLLIFEDDAVFIDNGNEIMEEVIKQLPEDFDLLYLGCNFLVPPERYSENLFKINSAYSSHAILYSKKAIETILSLWSEENPYDNFLMRNVQCYGKSYCVNPMLCVQRPGVSNIFKYDPGRQIGIERYYNVGTNEIDWGAMMNDRFVEFTKDL